VVTDAVFTNSDEAYGLPTMWEDKVTGTVTGADSFTQNATVKTGQVQYYLVAANAADPAVAFVSDLTELEAALADADITTIVFDADITTDHKVLVSRPVAIDGAGFDLT